MELGLARGLRNFRLVLENEINSALTCSIAKHFQPKAKYDVHILRVRLRVLTQELARRLTRSTQERTVHAIDDGYEKGS